MKNYKYEVTSTTGEVFYFTVKRDAITEAKLIKGIARKAGTAANFYNDSEILYFSKYY